MNYRDSTITLLSDFVPEDGNLASGKDVEEIAARAVRVNSTRPNSPQTISHAIPLTYNLTDTIVGEDLQLRGAQHMAKKKSAAPSKTCVDPKCAATMHARQLVCPTCGKEQPVKRKVGKKAKPKAQPTAPRATAPAATPSGLPQAVNFVRQVGGLKQAQKLLSQIEEIKNL